MFEGKNRIAEAIQAAKTRENNERNIYSLFSEVMDSAQAMLLEYAVTKKRVNAD